jgi:hypothetical protein
MRIGLAVGDRCAAACSTRKSQRLNKLLLPCLVAQCVSIGHVEARVLIPSDQVYRLRDCVPVVSLAALLSTGRTFETAVNTFCESLQKYDFRISSSCRC